MAWVTAAELAALALPGLPGSPQGVNKRAASNGWPRRRRDDSSHAWEFQVSAILPTLSPEARQSLLALASQQAAAELPAPVTPAGGSPTAATPAGVPSAAVAVVGDTTHLTNNQRAIMDARCTILAWVERLAPAAGGITAARLQAEKMAKAGTLPEEIARLAPLANAKSGTLGKRTLSKRSLIRWHSERAAAGGQAAALAPKAPAPDMRVPPWAPALMALLSGPSKRSVREIVEKELSKPGALPMGIQAPSYDQAKRFLTKVSTVDRERGRRGPREMKALLPYHRRDTSGLWPLDVVQADGHTHDAEVEHPRHHRPFRPEITTIVDLATRVIVGWSASLAENALGVTDAIIYMATKWGIPAVWYVDNGSGFNNQLMDDPHTGVMARLGIEKMNRAPYNAQAGGYIERVQQTVWVKGAKRLPTYVGADMDREARQKVYQLTRADIAKVGRSRTLMTWDEFLSWAEEQVREYNHTPHRSLPKITDPANGRRRHMTPMEAWDKAVAEGKATGAWEPIKLSQMEAADIARPYEEKTVSRGTVQALGQSYFSNDLVPWHGETVLVGYDVHDASKVYVRDVDGRLITIAGFQPKRDPVPRSLLERGYEKRAKGRLNRLRAHVNEVEAELNPGRIIDIAPVQLPDNVTAIHQGLVLELTATPAAPEAAAPSVPETAEARYDRWRQLDADLAAGCPLSDDDQRWHRRYPLSAEWKAQDQLFQSFNPSRDAEAG